LTDFLIKKEPEEEYRFYDPLEDDEPITVCVGDDKGKWAIELLNALGFDVAVE
jgi:hypothetical protein